MNALVQIKKIVLLCCVVGSIQLCGAMNEQVKLDKDKKMAEYGLEEVAGSKFEFLLYDEDAIIITHNLPKNVQRMGNIFKVPKEMDIKSFIVLGDELVPERLPDFQMKLNTQ